MPQFEDRLALDAAPRRTADGYAVLAARVARGGNVQTYLGAEVGVADRATVRVYRPAEEVFRRDALASYAGVPVTLDHPAQGRVDATSWKDLAVGEVGDEVLRDGEFVRVPMILRDAAAIAAVEAGQRELSMGYEAQLTLADGTTPDGQAFDAVMSGFKMNHVAIVHRARGGEELRIGDGAAHWGAAPIQDHQPKGNAMTLSTVVLGDKAVQVAATDAQAVESFKAETAKTIADAQAKFDAALADKDKALAAKDAQIDDLKSKVLDAKALDKLVADRSALITTAKLIAGDSLKVEGLSDAEIRKATVLAKRGDAAIADKSEAYIDAAFDLLAEDARKAPAVDPLRATLADRNAAPQADYKTLADQAYAKRTQALSSAWEGAAN